MQKARFYSWKCHKCGQEELILVTMDGRLIRPKEGMEVYIAKMPSHPSGTVSEGGVRPSGMVSEELEPWAPQFALRERDLMAVFGIMAPSGLLKAGFGPEEYSMLYIQKLRSLLESWEGAPFPVLFDKYFSAPYIGAGDPSQVLIEMWQGLEELRRPVAQVQDLLQRGERVVPLTEEQKKSLGRVLSELNLDEFLRLVSSLGRG